MTRSVIFVLLIIVAMVFVFEFTGTRAGAQDTAGLAQVLNNQERILEKLDNIEKKLNVIRVRLR